MKGYSVITVILLFLFVFSCTENNTGRYDVFAETVSVSTVRKDFDGVFMRYPYRVRVHDTSVYIMDLHGDEYFCHEFSYPSLKFIRSFVKRGRGPGELSSMGNIHINGKGKPFILGDYSGKVYAADAEGRLTVIAEMPDDIAFYPDFVLYNDSTYIIPDYSGKNRFFFADHSGNITRKTGRIPEINGNPDIPEAALGQVWRPFIGYNAQNGILAVAAQFGEVIEIYDLNKDSHIVKTGPGGMPEYRFNGGEAYPTGIKAYSDVFVGDRYIYAVYWGHEFKEIIQRKITWQGGKYIHVFDFEGNPVKRYELDRYITGIHVDEKNGLALGTDINEEQLVEFRLN